ncbi:Uu.00g120830.m01.CDS01 [Anthostomella pinea]|uniref:Crh-like protein n=1 Tax=Anthostomella pinea TaxID=933095 RepID=A0AAI8VHW9_9PEZI|nr:Uu.00g120830.m01.CDS01 [Anthostomella pinea]
MFSKVLSTTAVVLAATNLASAQTFSSCNPLEKTGCPDEPAVGRENTKTIDFTKGESDFFTAAQATTIDYTTDGAVFTINTETEAPTIQSSDYIFFGKIDLTVIAAKGQGVVTSFVLQSADLDEIDWEWLGGDVTQVQSNYFGKGNTTTYDRGAYHSVNAPQTEEHTYTIDWTKDYVHWYVDGTQVRELLYADAVDGKNFPQTPCQIKLGTWVAGSSTAAPGTVEWAGGLTDFSQAPFKAYYKSITIQDYSNNVAGAKSYSWPAGSDGSYGSIDVLTTDGKTSSSEEVNSITTKSIPTSTASGPSSTGSSGSLESSSDSSSDASSTTATVPTTMVTGITLATGTSSPDSESDSNNAAAQTGSSTSSGSVSQSSSGSSPTSTVVQVAGALKTGLSGAVLGAGLAAALFL